MEEAGFRTQYSNTPSSGLAGWMGKSSRSRDHRTEGTLLYSHRRPDPTTPAACPTRRGNGPGHGTSAAPARNAREEMYVDASEEPGGADTGGGSGRVRGPRD